jgi:hypothetical protein
VTRALSISAKIVSSVLTAILFSIAMRVVSAQAPGGECARGTRQTGNGCVAFAIPANAEIDVYGSNWTCRRGYHPVGEGCVAVAIPANAEIDVYGSNWTCRRGYHQVGEGCVAVAIPANAEIDVYGSNWTCKGGFKLASGSCIPMSLEELRKSERERAIVKERIRSDESTCIIDGKAIEGDRAEVVVQKKSCGDYFVADGPQWLLSSGLVRRTHSHRRETIVGPINSYGFKDVCYVGHETGRVWVDDYLLSKSRALEKYVDKCH